MEHLNSQFKLVGELDSGIMEQAEEVNALLLHQFQALQNQIRRSIIFTGDLSGISQAFREKGVDVPYGNIMRVEDFARAFVDNHRKVSGFGGFPHYFYFLEYYGVTDASDEFLPETAVWHVDDWKNRQVTAAHISPLDTEVIHGRVSVPFAYSAQGFNNSLHTETEKAVQAKTVPVRSAFSGEVTHLDSLQCVHRRAPLDTSKISVPFLRHRALSVSEPPSYY